MWTPEQIQAELERRQQAQQAAPSGSTREQLEAELARRQGEATAQPSIPEGATLLGTFGDNGRVYQMPDGSRGAVSAGGATRDESAIDRIMAGETFAAATLPGWQETALQEMPVAARAASAIQGVPFVGEWADEAVGSVFGETARDAMRFSQQAMQDQRPGQALALQLGAGILGTAPLIMGAAPYVAKGAGLAGQMLRGGLLGAAGGATEGAVSGLGAGEGGLLSGDRLQSAGQRGAIGGGIGGILGSVAPAAMRGIGNLMRDPAERGAAAALGVSAPAARFLQRVMGSENPADASAALREAGRTAMPVDASTGARGVLDAILQRPETSSTVRGRITDRATEVYGDVTGALNRTMGEPRGLISVEDAIRTDASPAIREAYERAYSVPIDYASDAGRSIESLLERLPRSTVLKAVNSANERMRFDGSPANQIMAQIGDDGAIVYQEMPNVMQMDYIKRAFQSIARDGTDPITGQMTSDAAFAARIAREIRDATREAVPEYGKALGLAADQLSQQAAVDFGARILNRNVTREMVQREIKGATEPELEAMRLALRSQIDENLANVRRIASNPTEDVENRQLAEVFGMLTSPASQAKITALLGDGAEDVLSSISAAVRALDLRASVARGSQTFGRQAVQELTDTINAPNIAEQFAMGQGLQGSRQIMQALTTVTPESLSGKSQAILNEVADILTRSGQDEAQQALQIIQRAAAAKPVSEKQAYRVIAAVNTALAGSVYQTGTRYPESLPIGLLSPR